jgi:WD40 repeat protein
MKDEKPDDRLPALNVPADSGEEPAVYAVSKGRSGWTLSRRGLMAAAAAALSVDGNQSADAQVCTGTIAHRDSITAIAVTFDGQALISASLDGTIKLWKLPVGAYYFTKTLSGPVYALTVTPDNRFFTAAGNENVIRNFTVAGTEGTQITGHTAPVRALAVTPDGRFLISGSQDTSIRMWALPAGKFYRTLTGHNNIVRCLAVSPDGEILASGGDDIRIWSIPEGRVMYTLTGHNGDVLSVAISPDGKVLASAGTDGTVRLWSLPDGKPLATLTGHTGSVQAVAFRLDGKILYSGGSDGAIRSWSVKDHTSYQTAQQQGEAVSALYVTPDGQRLASGGLGSLKLWQVLDTLSPLLCMIDLAVNPSTVSGLQYKIGGVVYTLPCGATIPAGVACTCNCVPGSYGTTVYYTPVYYTPVYYSPVHYYYTTYYTTYYTVYYLHPN